MSSKLGQGVGGVDGWRIREVGKAKIRERNGKRSSVHHFRNLYMRDEVMPVLHA